MSCHEKSFSTYQREVIKKVKALMGDTQVNYEKSPNNHLQIKIAGIDRVFFTSSTPSDSRSLDNFIGDIRAEINRLAMLDAPQQIPAEPPNSVIKADARKSAQAFMVKVFEKTHKKLQRRLKHIERDEYQVFTTTTLDNRGDSVREFRKKLIKSEVEKAINTGKGKLFIPPGLNKKCQAELEEHLNTVLPSIPEYHHRMTQDMPLSAAAMPQHSSPVIAPLASILPAQTQQQTPTKVEPSAAPADTPVAEKVLSQAPSTAKIEAADTAAPHNVLDDLINAKPHKRLAQLKALSKQHIALLIDDCQKALQQKHQDDIDFLAEQMQSRGVSLHELQDALK